MNIPENSNTKRISIDLPEELISRFDQLRKEWGFRARGPVIEKILKELLQEDDLLPKNQQQEIDFNDKKNNDNLNRNGKRGIQIITIESRSGQLLSRRLAPYVVSMNEQDNRAVTRQPSRKKHTVP